MEAGNLNWKKIKELAEMALKNGNDFSINISKDGDVDINISKSNYISYTPYTKTTTTPLSNPQPDWDTTKDLKITC